MGFDSTRKEDAGAKQVRRYSGSGPEGQSLGASTPLGKRIREIRARMEANGERFLSWDEIDAELDRERDERLRREATEILERNAVRFCSCKRCGCDSGRLEDSTDAAFRRFGKHGG